MDFDLFSPGAFESLAGDPRAARRLADELQKAVAAELGGATAARFRAIVDRLRALGHRLEPFGDQEPDEGHVRDYANPTCCALRLAYDLVISAGYKDVQGEGGWRELARDDMAAHPGVAPDTRRPHGAGEEQLQRPPWA